MPLIDDLVIQLQPGSKEQLKREADKLGLDMGRGVAEQTEKGIGGLEQKLGGMLKRVGAALVAAFAINKIIDFGQAAVAESEKVEKAWTRVGLALKVAGTDIGVVRGTLAKAVADLEAATPFDQEDDILPGFEKLVQLTGSYEKALAALPHVADLAAGANIGFTEAAEMVGRGLEGNTRQFKLLNIEVGAGDDLFGAIDDRFGGMAAGSMTDLQHATLRNSRGWGDLLKVVGDALREAMAGAGVMDTLGTAIEGLTGWVAANKDQLGDFVRIVTQATVWVGEHLFKAVVRSADAFRVTFFPVVVSVTNGIAKLAGAMAVAADALARLDELTGNAATAQRQRAYAQELRGEAKALEEWAAAMQKAQLAAQGRLSGLVPREPMQGGGSTTPAPNLSPDLGKVVDDPEAKLKRAQSEAERLHELLAKIHSDVNGLAQKSFVVAADFLEQEMDLRTTAAENREQQEIELRDVSQETTDAVLSGIEQEIAARDTAAAREQANARDRLDQAERERDQVAQFNGDRLRAIQDQGQLIHDIFSAVTDIGREFGGWNESLEWAAQQTEKIFTDVSNLMTSIASGNVGGIIVNAVKLGIDWLGPEGMGFWSTNKDPERFARSRASFELAMQGDMEALADLEEQATDFATSRAREYARHLADRARMYLEGQQATEDANRKLEEEQQAELDAMRAAAEARERAAEAAADAAERHAEAVDRQRDYESESFDVTADFQERYARDEANGLDARRQAYQEALVNRQRAEAAHRATIDDLIEQLHQAERDERAHRERVLEMERYFAEERQRIAEEAARAAEERERARIDAMIAAEEQWVRTQERGTLEQELNAMLAAADQMAGEVGNALRRAVHAYKDALLRMERSQLGEGSPRARYEVSQAERAVQEAQRRLEDAMRERERAAEEAAKEAAKTVVGPNVAAGFTVQRSITAESAGQVVGELGRLVAVNMDGNVILREQLAVQRYIAQIVGRGGSGAGLPASDLLGDYQQAAALQGNTSLT